MFQSQEVPDGASDGKNDRDCCILIESPPDSIINCMQTVHGQADNTSQLSWESIDHLKRRLIYDLTPKVIDMTWLQFLSG